MCRVKTVAWSGQQAQPDLRMTRETSLVTPSWVCMEGCLGGEERASPVALLVHSHCRKDCDVRFGTADLPCPKGSGHSHQQRSSGRV